MGNFSFRRMVNIEAAPIIRRLLDVLEQQVHIHDARGRLIFGNSMEDVWGCMWEVKVHGQAVGCVLGRQESFWLGKVLSYFAEEHMNLAKLEHALEGEKMKNKRLREDLAAINEKLSSF